MNVAGRSLGNGSFVVFKGFKGFKGDCRVSLCFSATVWKEWTAAVVLQYAGSLR
jgi:hypothetical protein